ncbi:MAG: family containing protein [Phycisphaerales bacterium]|nr:family containing protein [Phycisphaerales bacterium]
MTTPPPDPTRRTVIVAAVAGAAGFVARAVSAAAADPSAAGKDPAPMPQPVTPLAAPSPSSSSRPSPEFYELRAYRLRRGPMPGRLDAYLKGALIPAAARAGCGPVGAFTVTLGPQSPSVYVLIPHPSADAFAAFAGKLAADAAYQKVAEPFHALPPTDPPFAGLEVKLMRAFGGVPRLEVPPAAATGGPRLFELRTYRSHGDPAARKKVEMFDAAGEVAIFRRLGLTPVFFASDLTGEGLPSLTYMLTYPDMVAREKAWAAFRADPEWAKLRTTPGYTDAEIVTGIDNQVLAPTAYSQV